MGVPVFQLLPCLALFLINTITQELSWYFQATVDDHWCWSSRPFSGWHSVSHIVLQVLLFCVNGVSQFFYGFLLCIWANWECPAIPTDCIFVLIQIIQAAIEVYLSKVLVGLLWGCLVGIQVLYIRWNAANEHFLRSPRWEVLWLWVPGMFSV